MNAARCWKRPKPGYSAAEIRDRYQQSGYLVYWVKPRGLISGGEIRLPQRRRVTLEQFVIFNQQFLTLVRAGLPIVQALELLAKRQRNQYFRMLLEDVRDRTKGGELISDAFEKQGAFPKDLFDDADGGREERQSRRSAVALCLLPAPGSEFSQEADLFAGLSGNPGGRRDRIGHHAGDIRDSEVFRVVLRSGPEAAADDGVHDQHGDDRQEVSAADRDCVDCSFTCW